MEQMAVAALIRQLGQRARSQQVVATQTLDNGLTLLLYPLPQGLLVGLGWGAGQAHRLPLAELLRKRSGTLSRYGEWLPATLVDGSCYVVRRLSEGTEEGGSDTLGEDALRIAQELLT